MIPKKTNKGNLESRRHTFALIGLVLVLGLVYLCFELFATQKNQNYAYTDGGDGEFELELSTPLVTLPPPPAKIEPEILKEYIIRATEKDGNVNLDELLKMLQKNFTDPIPDIYPKSEIEIIVPPVEELPLFHSEVMPAYQGGEQAMYAFLMKHLTYPEKAIKIGVQGVSYIEFVIEKDGSVSNTKVLASLYPDCDNEAMRVIKMLKFSPGLVNSQPVRVYFRIPVQFKLQD